MRTNNYKAIEKEMIQAINPVLNRKNNLKKV